MTVTGEHFRHIAAGFPGEPSCSAWGDAQRPPTPPHLSPDRDGATGLSRGPRPEAEGPLWRAALTILLRLDSFRLFALLRQSTAARARGATPDGDLTGRYRYAPFSQAQSMRWAR
eukprot:1039799-Prorocentrum_minimum.AAC.3